jgi:hypothetical protein
MNLFTVSLAKSMTSDVETQRPMDLHAAMSLARAFERCASVTVPPLVPCFQPRSRSQVPGALQPRRRQQLAPQHHLWRLVAQRLR